VATSGFEGAGRTTSPDLNTTRDSGNASRQGTEAFMKEFRQNYDRARQREHENIIEAYLDLGFKAGDAQWDATALNERQMERRPCMVINLIPQFVRQLTGEQRMLKPAVKVVPTDGVSTVKTAQVYENLIRYIENRSDAISAYTNGGDQQVTAGIGHWRVDREYSSEATFDQELVVNGIDDGISVLWDPDASKPTREDAGYCIVPIDMSKKKFEDEFPGKTSDSIDVREYQWRSEWATDDHVRVAEYWLKKSVKRKLALLPDGSIIKIDDIEDEGLKNAILDQAQIKEREGHEVWRYLLSLTDILEEGQLSPGRFIPIVPCLGEEVKIGRRIIRHGLVRFMRDPQRIYNYYASAEVEITALQPKAPWIGTENNFTDTLPMWEQANTKNYPFLIYRPDPSNQGAPPQRGKPPMASEGILEGLQRAEADLHRVTGIYPASLGQQGPEQSGVAINARRGEGDQGTFVYVDNFTRAIKHTGKILVDMIPHVYDTQREVRIMAEDGSIKPVQINQPTRDIQGLQIIQKVENDVTTGTYDIMIDVGPSYATRREEAKEGMITLLQTIPQIGPLLMDLVAKAQDWPMAEQIAERARTLLPPQIQMMEMMKAKGVPDEQIQQMLMQQSMQPKPDPDMEVAQAKVEHEKVKTQHDIVKTQRDQIKSKQDIQKLQSHALESRGEAISGVVDLQHQTLMQNLKEEGMRLDNELKRKRLQQAVNGNASES